MEALLNKINDERKYYALYRSFSPLEKVARVKEAIPALVEQIKTALNKSKVDGLRKLSSDDSQYSAVAPTLKIRRMLKYLSAGSDKDIVIFFDSIDSLAPAPFCLL
ncbi:MAG: hypothetical protein LBO66_02415 [Deltaproteobacteria bacterium]|nr:hypothetical protein [Deltaproteobacteria bacterium]